MTPTEPSSGKTATMPSHYEALRGLVARYERSFRITGAPDVPVYFTGTDKVALTALLADYERMREGLDSAIQQLAELAQPLTPALNGSYAKGEQIGYENAVRILTALRATLKGEKHE